MTCYIFTGPCNYSLSELNEFDKTDYIIGVDQGAKYLASNNLHMHLAIGDFDSINDNDLDVINTHSEEIQTHPIKKDYTDTHLAILEAHKRGYEEIILYGGVGNRFDHSYANMLLLRLGNITIVNDTTKMYILQPGTYTIKNEFPYISFFALETVERLSLQGFLYPLENIQLTPYDPLCISNQGSGRVTFGSGLLLVVHQRDTK
ncbi:thiamine diphosphokinase [Candidatus Xianfuyuplasma coldseepsis]|uniref:Thiamine diphosphokinase n=1 Tax=Candidatus Xianfuyuplasma coldseepsis TaxID=2782163 RepID=A0A7L7KTF7_9MOLU|nr:thiamine diphosphokinase [Xianfuyuplasma coldseepsis]QMS85582.1 thiamine diphosphokinase [Xianfuyuplasma coldseepsis]